MSDPAPPLAERFLALVGVDRPEQAGPKLDAFARIFLLHLGIREWVTIYNVYASPSLSPYLEQVSPLAILFTLCFGLSFTKRARQLALIGAACGLSYKLVALAPAWSNHGVLEFLIGLFLVVGGGRRESQPVVVQALRWLAFVPFFWSGLQKFLHGTYFQGTFLAYQVSGAERFASFYRLLLPREEWEALRAATFPGPYEMHSWIGLATSNSVWIAEIACALLLLSKRFRTLGVLGAAGLISGIEVAAREILFGLVFANLLLLYLDWDKARRLVPIFYFAYAVTLANAWGLVRLGFLN